MDQSRIDSTFGCGISWFYLDVVGIRMRRDIFHIDWKNENSSKCMFFLFLKECRVRERWKERERERKKERKAQREREIEKERKREKGKESEKICQNPLTSFELKMIVGISKAVIRLCVGIFINKIQHKIDSITRISMVCSKCAPIPGIFSIWKCQNASKHVCASIQRMNFVGLSK